MALAALLQGQQGLPPGTIPSNIPPKPPTALPRGPGLPNLNDPSIIYSGGLPPRLPHNGKPMGGAQGDALMGGEDFQSVVPPGQGTTPPGGGGGSGGLLAALLASRMRGPGSAGAGGSAGGGGGLAQMLAQAFGQRR